MFKQINSNSFKNKDTNKLWVKTNDWLDSDLKPLNCVQCSLYAGRLETVYHISEFNKMV